MHFQSPILRGQNQKIKSILAISAALLAIFSLNFEKKQADSFSITRSIKGNSMEPLLREGDQIKIELGVQNIGQIRPNSLVVLHDNNNRTIVKKVVALPADFFALKSEGQNAWSLSVNGDTIYLSNSRMPRLFNKDQAKVLFQLAITFNGKIPPESILVLGEDINSLDSAVFGLLGVDDLLGVVVDIHRNEPGP